MINEINDLKDLLSVDFCRFKVVSFDFFDTLIYRHNDEEQVVKRCFTEYFNHHSLTVSYEDFCTQKASSELEIRGTEKYRYDNHFKLSDVYNKLFLALGIENHANGFFQRLVEMEMDNFKLTTNAKKILQSFEHSNTKLIICSDTYYSNDDFSLFLNHLEINFFFDEVYLSCENEGSKANGILYKTMLKLEGVIGKDVIHIGDNEYSDVKMALRENIKSIHYKLTASDLEERELHYFGKTILAPVVADFITQVAKQSKPNNILVFLGRDGFLLEKVFKCLFPKRTEVKYLHVTRVIMNQLSFSHLSNEVFDYLTTQFKTEGIWGLVTVFGLFDSSFSNQLQSQLTKYNLEKHDLITQDIKLLIESNQELCSSFENVVCQRKKNINSYFIKHGFLLDKNNYELVDVGWNGSIFLRLNQLFSNIQQCHLLVSTRKVTSGLSPFVSFDGELSTFATDLVPFRELIEFALAENIGSIQYINESLIPEVCNISKNPQQAIIQSGVLDYCNDVNLLSDGNKNANLNRLVNYFNHLPDNFISSLKNISPNTSISDRSVVYFRDLLPTVDMNNINNNQAEIKNKQANIYRFLEWIKSMKQHELVIYGAGSGTEMVLPFVKDECLYIIDLDSNLHGQRILGKLIRPINTLGKHCKVVVVTVLGRKNQILSILNDYDVIPMFLEDNL